MLSKVKYQPIILIILFSYVLLPSALILFNKLNTDEFVSLQEINNNFDAYETKCFSKTEIVNTIQSSEKNYDYTLRDRDIYLSQNLENIFCLGNVVDVYVDKNETTIFIGTNPKIKTLFSYSWLFVVLVFSFIKTKNKERLLLPIIFLYYLSQFIFYNRGFSFFDLLINFIATLITLLIVLIVFDYETYKKSLTRLENFYNSLLLKFENFFSNKKDSKFKYLNSFLFIVILALGVLKKIIYTNKSSIVNDVLIQVYTSARMFFYDQTSFEAALNQHTPIMPYLYKFIYYLFEYENFEKGVGLLGFIYSVLTSIVLYFLILKLIHNKILASLISICFLFFTFDMNFLNREFGILIFSLIILSIINYEIKPSNKLLFLIVFLSVFQLYNLESFILSLVLLNSYLIYFSQNKRKILTSYVVMGTLSFIVIYGSLIINGEIGELLSTNYLFHLQNISPNFENTTIFKAVGLTIYEKVNLNHIIFLGLVINFLISLRNKKFSGGSFEILLYAWLFVELINLIITGPRFWNYGINLVLPSLLIYVSILRKISENQKGNVAYRYVLVIIFLFSFFSSNISNLINFQNISGQKDSLINEIQEEALFLVDGNNSKPEIVLTWIHPSDWEWTYGTGEILPATKYWWWFHMRYYQTHMYTWEKNWDEENIKEGFYSDLELEQPEYAIINTGIVEPPEYFVQVINEFYTPIFEKDLFIVFQRDSELKLIKHNQ